MKNYNKFLNLKQKILLENLYNKKGFLLAFRVWGNPADIFDSFLPPPNILKRFDNNYLIAWLIEGYFLTKNNRKFLEDIITKMIETFFKYGALRVDWIGYINISKLGNSDILHLNAYNLRDDINPYLEPNPKKTNKEKEYKALELLASQISYKESDDAFFDWLRFKVYDFVKENGKNALTLDYVKELATLGYEIMGHKKGISTPLAKAKAIYKWVMENYNTGGINNWNYKRKTKDDKELAMTRRERALANSKKRYEEAHKTILSLATGMFADNYKKKDGSFNINKLAKDSGYSRKTIYKHLKDEGLI